MNETRSDGVMTEILGRKLSVRRFISMLDDARIDVGRSNGEKDFSDYCKEIYPLQEEAYARASKFSGQSSDGFALPKTVSDGFETLMKRFPSVDWKKRLDKAERLSRKDAVEHAEEQSRARKDAERTAEIAKRIGEDSGLTGLEGEDPARKALFLIELAKRKTKDETDEFRRGKTAEAALLWSGILMRSVLFENLTAAQMEDSVRMGFVKEEEVSKILREKGDERDYEWYSEDLTGEPPSHETILPISRILMIAEPRFRKTLELFKPDEPTRQEGECDGEMPY